MTIAIVTDSTADIPNDIAEHKDIHIVPNILIIEGKNYKDGIDISRMEFYDRLPHFKSPPTTATASAGEYHKLFENLINEGYSQVISLNVSETFSGVINAASTAAQSFGDKVHVIDSQQVTLGLGFQVIEAAELAASGASLNKILHRINEIQSRTVVYAMLDTLEFLHRSGRVSWARARIGNLLKVKPFLEVKNGQAVRIGDVRTRRKGMDRLLNILNNLGPLKRLAILHSNAKDDAGRLLQAYGHELSNRPLIVNVTTTIGTHVGPNGLGFAAVVGESNNFNY